MAERVDVTAVAEPFRREVQAAVQARVSAGRPAPLLVGLLGNDDPSAVQYAERTGRACLADGIRYELRKVNRIDMEDALSAANADPNVHGIIIYYPVFGAQPSFYGGSMDDYLRDSIAVSKDVEGLCHTYRFNLYRNVRFLDADHRQKCLLPCTPLAVVKTLESLNVYAPHESTEVLYGPTNRLSGKTVVIFNRSEIVGRPLAAMLANDGADVYSVDISTIYLLRRGKLLETPETPESACRKADVVILGVPTRDYRLPTEWVKEGAVVINVATFKNVEEEEIMKVKGVKYVPQVGKVTVAMLERNLIRLYENFH